MITDRSVCPLGPHAGKRMSQVPVEWLEEFSTTSHRYSDHDEDLVYDVLNYIQVNRTRIDRALDAMEAR